MTTFPDDFTSWLLNRIPAHSLQQLYQQFIDHQLQNAAEDDMADALGTFQDAVDVLFGPSVLDIIVLPKEITPITEEEIQALAGTPSDILLRELFRRKT